MEPPLINDSTFSSANPSSYSLSEIWPLPLPHFSPHPDNSTLTHLTTPPCRKRNLPPNHHPDDDCSNKKHLKVGGESLQGDENGALQAEEADATSVAGNTLPEEHNAKPPSEQPPKQDYIHVRARRGQATDSHSLAERARREKISERMKILQELVPGCNKVIGKALVLDEIINYIQSLQRQVEFLSMKLEAVNSRMNINPAIECFPSKDVAAQPFDLAGIIFGPQVARGYAQGSQPGWLHMQIAGGFDKPA